MWRQIYRKWEEIAVFLENGAENGLQSWDKERSLMEIRRKKEVDCVKKEENRYSKRKMDI